MKVFLCLLGFILAACSGYQLGGQRPSEMEGVVALYIPMATNLTLTPRAAPLATNSVVDAITRDGSYGVRSLERAQAELRLTLESISYDQNRSRRDDTLRPEELETKARLSYKIISLIEPGKVLLSGSVQGQSRFFADEDLQKSRDNALPDALRRAALEVVSRIADGV